MKISDLPVEVQKAFFTDWYWKETYSELNRQAIKEVEAEVGFWRSVLGVKKQILQRHQYLFWQKVKELKK